MIFIFRFSDFTIDGFEDFLNSDPSDRSVEGAKAVENVARLSPPQPTFIQTGCGKEQDEEKVQEP